MKPKTRVEKFLVQLEMAEPDDNNPYAPGTRWIDLAGFMRCLESSANTWAGGLTHGPKPKVTLTKET